MTHFIKRGDEYIVTDSANIDLHDRLPNDTFIVRFAPEKGFYLNLVTDMVVPDKLYGNTQALAERFLSTFAHRTVNTGILLAGEKGSGKTLLMRVLSRLGHMPTIIVNDQFSGDAFNKFMTSIDQPCIVCFDEFEKTYDEENQNAILTLLDGVFTSKKLFVFTCNDSWKLNKHLLNRPGRMFYNITFKGLGEAEIRAYCEDKLFGAADERLIDGVLSVAKMIDAFNFDMLKALVEEMNRYNEDALTAVKLLNIRPESSTNVSYNAKVKRNGIEYSCYGEINVNPLTQQRTNIFVSGPMKPSDMPEADTALVAALDNEDRRIELQPKDLVRQNAIGDLIFHKGGYEITFEKTTYSEYHHGAF